MINLLKKLRLVNVLAGVVCLLTACGSAPPPPDWQANAESSMAHAIEAYLLGNARVEAQEFLRASSEIAGTGRPDLYARLALMHCAGRVASLVMEPCVGFEKLRQDAAKPERVYANYIAGTLSATEIEFLPPQHRAVAMAMVTAANHAGTAQVLQNIVDPLARLVAAGVVFGRGQANPTVISLAVDTASAQGWRRPLLAWLGVQRLRAEKAGDTGEAERIGRRMTLVEGATAK